MILEILSLILKWAVPTICVALLAYITARLKRYKANEAGTCCLLRNDILCAHDKWTRLGYCPEYAKSALEKTYKAYHDLGGNDVATELYHKVLALPSIKEDNK